MAEAQISDPHVDVSPAGVAFQRGFKGCSRGVDCTGLGFMADGETAGAEAVVWVDEGGAAEYVADGVVDAEAGLGPGEELEEDDVAGEDVDEL